MERQSSSGGAAKILITSAAFVVVVAGMRAAQAIIVPFLLALFITILTAPALFWLRSKRISTWCSLTILISGIAVVGFFFAALIGKSINQFMIDMPLYQVRLQNLSNEALVYATGLGVELPAEVITEQFNPSVAMSVVGKGLQELGGILANGFLIILCAMFMLVEASSFPAKLKAAFGPNIFEGKGLSRFSASVKQYMVIKTWISIGTGVLVWIWLMFMGVDYPELWGVLAFVLNFVPNIGAVIAAVPAVLLTVVQLGPGPALLVTLGYVVINGVFGNILEVKFMGKGLGLSTFVVFLSLIFWGWLLGPVGMLLSLPLTMMLRIALESNPETRWLSILLGPEPAEASVAAPRSKK